MVNVRGRLLERPTVKYGERSEIPVIDHKGRWNMRHKIVFSSQRLENWGVLRIVRGPDGSQKDQESFRLSFGEFLKILNYTLGKNVVTKVTKSWTTTIRKGNEDALVESFETCQEAGIRFLLIVLPDNDAGTYKKIKRLGDVDHGISTVCVLGEGRKFYKHDATQYYANVALKINLKIGGVNHILANQTSLYETTMVIGIDVTHPSPGPTKKTAPSVAAMVASVDDEVLSISSMPPIRRHS